MLLIILGWLFWFCFIFNIGYFVIHLFIREHGQPGGLYNFWFGYFVFSAILGLISLFSPLSGSVVLILTLINLILFVVNILVYNLRPFCLLNNIFLINKIPKVILFIFIILFVSYLSNQPVIWYDTYLYHLNSVKWLTDFGSVKGLANLHSRLGLNNIGFLVSAAMDSGPFRQASSHISNSLLFIVILIQLITHLLNKHKNTFSVIFTFVSIFMMSISFDKQVNSLSTDFSLLIFALISAFYIVTLKKQNLIFVLPILSLTATTKYSYFVVLVLFVIYYFISNINNLLARKIIFIISITIIFFSLFITRNLILSGWPFYPMKFAGINFEWQVPPTLIQDFNDTIKSWARLPGPMHESALSHRFVEWFPVWFENNKKDTKMNYLLLLAPLIIIYIFVRKKDRLIKIFIIGNLITLMYVFIVAPDLRFMWTPLVLSFSLALSTILRRIYKITFFKYTINSVLIIWSFVNLIQNVNFGIRPMLISVQKEESLNVKEIDIKFPDQQFHVWTPINGDKCGNSQLPCTPYTFGFKMLRPGYIYNGYISTKEPHY